MNAEALEQAAERLLSAKRSLRVLAERRDRQERESAWIDLITALGTIYAKLEQGAKVSGSSNAWFGRKRGERRSDPLLSYVHHARNSAEHGIVRSGRYAEMAVSFTGTMKLGTTAGLRFTTEGPQPFSTDPDLEPRLVVDDVLLMMVRDRGVTYEPPTEHLGAPLTAFGAAEVGRLAVDYVETMIEEARSLGYEESPSTSSG